MDKTKKKITKYNIIILSIKDSGKTNFCLRYVNDSHNAYTSRTFGTDSFVKNVILNNGEKIMIKLFDTASGERNKSICNNNIRLSNGVIFLYDITDKYTFDSAKSWSYEVEGYKDKAIALVGNKIDKEEDRQVTTEEGQNFANLYNFIFYETSTLNGTNVNECMNTIIQRIHENELKKKDEENIIEINKNVENRRPRKEGCLK